MAIALGALCGALCAVDALGKGTGPIACKRAPAGATCVPAACPAASNGKPCKPRPGQCKRKGKRKCGSQWCVKHPKRCTIVKPPAPSPPDEPHPSPDDELCDKRCRSIAAYLHNCERRLLDQAAFYVDTEPPPLTMCEWPDYIDSFPQDLYDAATAAWITHTATQAQLDAIEASSPDAWF